MASDALSKSLAFLANQIAEEATLQYNVTDKIEMLIGQLKWTRAFLDVAEKNPRERELIRIWIDDVRDISYSMEDELEKYNLVVDKRNHQNWVLRYACIFKFLVKRHQIGKSIDHLRNRIEVYRLQNIYDTGNSRETSRTNELRPGNLNLRQQKLWDAIKEDFSFVGLRNDLNTLKKRMLDTKEKRRCCISVVGMGGLGKTAIARKVYNAVKTNFEFSTWVYISKEFNIKDILEKISRDITWTKEENKDEIMKDEEKLGSKINEFLKDKKYLIVLDDIWDSELSSQFTFSK